MLSGRARVMQQSDQRKCRPTYQGKLRWHPIWDGNPRIAKPDERGDFQELVARDIANNRPYHTGKTAERWTYNLNFRPDVGEIYFTDDERAFGARYPGRILLEPHIKPGASPNKQWPLPHWQRLVRLLKDAGIELTQLGPHGTRILPGVNYIVTPSFRMAAAVLAGARAVVLHEGGLGHAAAALGVHGVVIFGNFTPVELTGYAVHRNIGASLGQACGMRVSCPCCAKAMAAIRPEAVTEQLMEVLSDRTRSEARACEGAGATEAHEVV